jgi:hypothetical protein
VEEFKKLLSAEVNRSMAELGRMREEKKVLEQHISDLFALKAKHGTDNRGTVSSHFYAQYLRLIGLSRGEDRCRRLFPSRICKGHRCLIRRGGTCL